MNAKWAVFTMITFSLTWACLVAANDNAAPGPSDPFSGNPCKELGEEFGLVACWPGDGDANDAVGLNRGMLQNGATFAPGLFGMAFSLDGIDDFVLGPESDDLDFPVGSSVSIVAWGYRTAGGTQHLVGKRAGCGFGGIAYQLAIGGGSIPDGDAPLNTWQKSAYSQDLNYSH